MSVAQLLLEQVLQLRHDTYDGALTKTAVPADLLTNILDLDITLAHGLGKVFTIRAAALDIVPYQFDMYCHNYFLIYTCPYTI
jgi:hypothetical protein